ncbi:hypothetical protein E2562_017703 [Oryza meyeriana var. granulata]|uniref:DUF834 domain-containing protein n=1 Tax=Oryza meyeriana var. granulata TaxID=110450 RepID=A0A6G1BX78_9ORYZ|nr:hypothetical protein E2562_017703 [Oryza meyeriana var. granulata]
MCRPAVVLGDEGALGRQRCWVVGLGSSGSAWRRGSPRMAAAEGLGDSDGDRTMRRGARGSHVTGAPDLELVEVGPYDLEHVEVQHRLLDLATVVEEGSDDDGCRRLLDLAAAVEEGSGGDVAAVEEGSDGDSLTMATNGIGS